MMLFKEIMPEKWPSKSYDPKRQHVYQNSHFLVQVFDEPNSIKRLSVCSTQLARNGRWKDGISWEDLQAIKAAVGFADLDAVEIYPAQSDIVNVANMRHLWVLPDRIDYAWRAKEGV